MLDPRMVLNLCIASTGLIWAMLVGDAAAGGGFSPFGYVMLTICAFNTLYLYQRYRGFYW